MEGGEQFVADVRDALNLVAPQQIDLVRIDIYLGANPFSDRPVIAFRIQVRDRDSLCDDLQSRVERRLGLCVGPMMSTDTATASERCARLAAASGAALLARGMRIGNGWGANRNPDGSADCWIEFLLGAPAGPALKTALVAVAMEAADAVQHHAFLGELLSSLERQCFASRPNKMSGYLIDAARAVGTPYMSLARSKTIWQFGWGSRANIFLGAACNDDGYVGFNIARNKLTAKHMFYELGLPTPRWTGLGPEEDPAVAMSQIGFPCVVKPTDSSLGEGVTTNIRTRSEFDGAVALARGAPARKLLVERHQDGHDHRLMVIDGLLFAAVRRDPPTVLGDGRRTVRQLVENLNLGRIGRPEEVGFLSPVAFDRELHLRLRTLGLSLKSIPPAGVSLTLRSAANRTAGGSATDVTGQVHPRVKQWAEALSSSVGLRVAGIDYVSPDISRDPSEVGGGFIELNATPGLQVLAAAGFDRVAIGRAVLGGTSDRIPVDLILCEPPAIERELSLLGRTPGHAVVGPRSAEIDGTSLDVSRLTPFETAGAVLRNRSVDRCTMVWSCHEMLLYGLPVDRLRQTRYAGPRPAAPWCAMLERISEEVLTESRAVEREAVLEIVG